MVSSILITQCIQFSPLFIDPFSPSHIHSFISFSHFCLLNFDVIPFLVNAKLTVIIFYLLLQCHRISLCNTSNCPLYSEISICISLNLFIFFLMSFL